MVGRPRKNLPAKRATVVDQHEANRRRTAVWKHPDREHIEDMLVSKSAYQVEKWLQLRYPVAADSSNKRFHIPRKTLIQYRTKYLVSPAFREPLDDPAMDEFLPPRPPRRAIAAMHWEIEEMEVQVEVARMEYLRCKRTDEELGMTQESTFSAFQMWQNATARLIDYKAKLRGYDEYELVPVKQQIDQRQQIEQVNVNVDGGRLVKPDEPEKFEAVKALMSGLAEEDRRRLLSGPLIDLDKARLRDDDEIIDEPEEPT